MESDANPYVPPSHPVNRAIAGMSLETLKDLRRDAWHLQLIAILNGILAVVCLGFSAVFVGLTIWMVARDPARIREPGFVGQVVVRLAILIGRGLWCCLVVTMNARRPAWAGWVMAKLARRRGVPRIFTWRTPAPDFLRLFEPECLRIAELDEALKQFAGTPAEPIDQKPGGPGT